MDKSIIEKLQNTEGLLAVANGQGAWNDSYYNSEIIEIALEYFSKVKSVINIDLEAYFKKSDNSNKILSKNNTKYGQLLTSIFQLSAIRYLQNNNIFPEYYMGLSLGEYACYQHFNVFSIEDYIKLLYNRGLIMDKATGKGTILIVNLPKIHLGARDIDYTKAVEELNYNNRSLYESIIYSPYTIGIACSIDKLDIIKNCFDKLKIKYKETNVEIPFHCSLVEDVANEFRQYLDSNINVEINALSDLNRNMLSNESKTYFNLSTKEELFNVLQYNIYNTIDFSSEIKKTFNMGLQYYINIGPSKTMKSSIEDTAFLHNRSIKVFDLKELNI